MTEELTITLRADLAAMVRERVASGEYDSASDMVEDGLTALVGDDPFSGPIFDAWVRDQLRPAIAAYEADPTRGVSLDVVRKRLAARHARRLAGG